MKKNIDLSDIKEKDLELTSSFNDIMNKRELRNKNKIEEENIDIEDMILEKKKSTEDLTSDLKETKKVDKEELKDIISNNNNNEIKTTRRERKQLENENNNFEEDYGKTQILELTRQMKYNFEENKKENITKKKKGISPLNVIGEVNLLCIGYYIYLLVFTSYQDIEKNYMITGGIIVLLVILFGMSVITTKKASKFFNILNILTIFSFIAFNIYTLI